MEHHHEDNANFDLTNTHFRDLQQFSNQQIEGGVALGNAVVGERADEISGIAVGDAGNINIGSKFDEVEGDGDENDEWKYIKEKHQSEKLQTQQQQQEQDLLKGFGNGGSSIGVDMLDQFDESNIFGNGGPKAATNGAGKHVLDHDHDDEVIKNDGEFSTNTSNTHSPGDVMQVEMKIEPAQQQPIADYFDEEEPSSLATNGTSSLSENQPQQQEPIGQIDDSETKDRPTDLDLDVHYQLNPEAKEFVPSFGSNPSSPCLAPTATLDFEVENANIEFSAQDFAKHLLGGGSENRKDDFVAQSPHKERYTDMEAIQLPAENDFEEEAAKRPHELAQEELLLGQQQQQQQTSTSPTDFGAGGDDCLDFQRQSPASFMDQGPETSVDLDHEMSNNGGIATGDDVMKQSIYVESTHIDAASTPSTEEPIEQLLNTVQQLPTETESLNVSFNNEQELIDQMNAEKEMLNFEEKEQNMNSPSTEEIQMNLRNDMFTAEHHEHVDEHAEMEENSSKLPADSPQEPPFLQLEERTLLMDISNPFDSHNVSSLAETLEASFEAVQNATENVANFVAAAQAQAQDLHFNDDFEQDLMKQSNDNNISPSPLSTEEKHLVEETKEIPQQHQEQQQEFCTEDVINALEQQMGDLQLTHHNNDDDGNIAQMEPVAEIANANHETENPFIASETEQFEHKDEEVEIKPQMVDQLQNENIFANEQLLQQQHNEFEVMQQPQQQHEHEQYQQHHEEKHEQHEEFYQQQQQQEEQHEKHQQQHEEQHQQQHEEQHEPYHQQHEELLQQHQQHEEQHHQLHEELYGQKVEQHQEQQQHQELQQLEELQQHQEHPQLEELQKPPTSDLLLENQFETKLEAAEPHVAPTTETEPAEPIKEKEAPIAQVEAVVAAAQKIVTTATTATKKPTTTATTKPIASKAKTTSDAKKSLDTKKSGLIGDAKKPLDTKKTTTTVSAAPRPRTAPAKTASTTTTVTEKKSTTSLTSSSAAPTARKTFTARPAPKPATTVTEKKSTTSLTSSSSAAPTARKIFTAKPAPKITTTAPRPASASASVTSAKSRISGATSPTKPTTLGVGVASTTTAKPRLSPRSTLTTQLRKSPTKPTAGSDLTTKASAPSVASRPRTTGVAAPSSSTTTTATKRFVARPAPKSTMSTTTLTTTTTTTTRRVTTNGKTNLNTTTTAAATAPKKPSPLRAAIGAKASPHKTTSNSTVTSIKSPRTKDVASSTAKKSNDTKSVTDLKEPIKASIVAFDEPKLNGNLENGLHLDNNGEQHQNEITSSDAVIDDIVQQQQQQQLTTETALIDA